ncbi:MAG: DUF1761 domain-containing protein [Pseudomonadota bacterium]
MITVLAILLAAAAGFASGAVWYGVHGARWMAATGRSKADIRADRSPLPFVIGAVAALLASAVLWHLWAAGGVTGFSGALTGGLGLGALLVAPWIVLNHAFAGRPRELWWIDGGYATLACTAIGAVHGLFL